MITKHLPYVKRIVYRIATKLSFCIEIDELINAGNIGLIKAAERYDVSRGNKFMNYAVHRIKGEVLSELRNRDFLSRSHRRKVRELEHTDSKLEKKLGRKAKDNEVLRELGWNHDQFYKIKEKSRYSFISLEEIGFLSKKDKKDLTSYLGNNDDTKDALTLIRLAEIENTIFRAIEQLAEKEKLVISLYYWEELTMKEIGITLDISEARVSQIHSKAINHLRRKLKKEILIEG